MECLLNPGVPCDNWLNYAYLVWFAFGIILIILEFFIPGIFIVFFGFGALITGGLHYLFNFGIGVQITIWIISSFVIILFGAKIIAVADVVEAMSSHRPYRLGLGIEAALEEVSRMRGVRYDATVVDACITLFRERGYSLPAAWAAPPIAMRSVAT